MNKFIYILILIIFSFNQVNAEIKDRLVEDTLQNVTLEQPYVNNSYDYESVKRIPIKLQITEKITTKNKKLTEGQELTFKVKQNVKYNKKIIIKKGTIVSARLSTIMTRGFNGIPAVIIIDNINIPNIEKGKIDNIYTKRGLSLSLYVYPIKWILTPIPGVGSLTNLILGGNATIKEIDTIEIYYYPDRMSD